MLANLRHGNDIEDPDSHSRVSTGPAVDDNIALTEDLLDLFHAQGKSHVITKPDCDRHCIGVVRAGCGLGDELVGFLRDVP